jgi:hypothetical protein
LALHALENPIVILERELLLLMIAITDYAKFSD